MHATTVVIGAGHAGLAMSRCLAERSVDHVILERGEVANSWRTERWDSLRLLTPNWLSRLPDYHYRGSDPDGFRSMAETINFIDGYARDMDVRCRRLEVELSYASTDQALCAAFRGGPVALAYNRFDDSTRAAVDSEYLHSIEPYRHGDGYRIPGEFVGAVGVKPSERSGGYALRNA